MDPTIALLLVLAALFVLLICDTPVAFSMAAAGILGLLLLLGFEVTARSIGSVPYTSVANYSLIVVPMFMLMGMLTLRSGIAESLFAIASRWLGWLPGGLGLATVAACAGFAAVTGSSIATVATIGRMAVTEMERYGYKRYFAAGIIGAAGTLGVLIPPSVALVLFGIMTGESVGRLLLAGIIPGILSAVVYALLVVGRVQRNPSLVGQQAREKVDLGALRRLRREERRAANESGSAVQVLRYGSLVEIGALFLIVVGGIYTGTFTATESGALGAIAAAGLLVIRAIRRRTPLLAMFRGAWKEAVKLSSMAFAILVGASIFSHFLIVGGIPSSLTRWLVELPVPGAVVVALLLLLLVPLGMFLDPISILIITVPLVYEPVTALGYSGIWLGVLYIKMIEIGLITPPVGMNAFVMAGTMPELSVEQVFRGLSPFLIADIATVALLFAVPSLVTWLPDLAAV